MEAISINTIIYIQIWSQYFCHMHNYSKHMHDISMQFDDINVTMYINMYASF